MRGTYPAAHELGLDDIEIALFEYYMRLRQIYKKAGDEFWAAMEAWELLDGIEEALQNEFAAAAAASRDDMQSQIETADHSLGIPTISATVIYTPGMYNAEIRADAARLVAESSAGSLILMLDDVFQRLRHSIVPKAPYASEFRIGQILDGSAHMSTLLYASGNAYRHSKDWVDLVNSDGKIDFHHREYDRAKKSLEILSGAIGLTQVASESVCVATLTVLGRDQMSASGPFERLWDRTEEAGLDFAAIYCEDDSAERVREALLYQDAYNRVETSFSMDERLFRPWSEDEPEDPTDGG